MYFILTTGNYPKVAAGPITTYTEAEKRAEKLVHSSGGKVHILVEALFQCEPSQPPVKFTPIVSAVTPSVGTDNDWPF